MQPHRKGHKSKNKTIQRRIEHKQRQQQKVHLVGKKVWRRKKKPKKGVKSAKVAPALCSAKQMALGEPVPKTLYPQAQL
jgi:hypothetical protein